MRVFDDAAYYELIENFDLFTNVETWITEDGWRWLEAGNPSVAIYDLTTKCDDVHAFAAYGLSNLSIHEQAVKLVDCIQRLGF